MWNPCIRKFRRLPDFCLRQYNRDAIGFACQSETNDYKVVWLCVPNTVNLPEVEADVYELSLDSWRRVKMSLRPNVVVSYIDPFCPATFVSEALHWLADVKEGERQFLHRSMILSFDVNDDKFGEIPLPDGCGLPGGRHRLAVFKGKLALISFKFSFRNDTSCSQCLI